MNEDAHRHISVTEFDQKKQKNKFPSSYELADDDVGCINNIRLSILDLHSISRQQPTIFPRSLSRFFFGY
jgi:hypothetical protein